MTKRTNGQVGLLKAAILTGSILATSAGTYLLGLQEPAEAATTVANAQTAALTIPSDKVTTLQLPPSKQGTQIEFKAIPQVVQPQIRRVARARSSRR